MELFTQKNVKQQWLPYSWDKGSRCFKNFTLCSFFGRVFCFFKKNPSFKIALSGRAGERRLRFTFWLTFFQSYMLPLRFNGLLLYLVGIKRRTSRCVACKRVTFFVMYLSRLMSKVYLLVNLFSKIHVTFILQWIAFIFGKDEEEDQKACRLQKRQLSLSLLCAYLPWCPRFTFWLTFFKVICYIYSSVDCFHIW